VTLLVDTCVWSLALRRRNRDVSRWEAATISELLKAIQQGSARMLGIVRQELLTGIKTRQQFEALKLHLSAFPDVEIKSEDYIEAARLANACRAKGVAAPVAEMLLCAVAIRENWLIFTSDPVFDRYAKIIGVQLHGHFLE
jgi:predicted nucleic acid-binding protein